MSFLRRMSGSKPQASSPPVTGPPERWYFLTGTPEAASAAFRALSQDEEFQLAPAGDASPDGKLLVRYYSAKDATGSERMFKARRLRLDFHGFSCPSDPDAPPESVDEIGRACMLLSGSPSTAEPELPLVVVLADQRFDTVMRGYHSLLNRGPMVDGNPARAELLYCDDANSAKNLLMLYEVRDQSARHDGRFQAWCSIRGISTAPFERTHA